MVLGAVCGLRKEYTTLGKWLKAWVRSTLIWFLIFESETQLVRHPCDTGYSLTIATSFKSAFEFTPTKRRLKPALPSYTIYFSLHITALLLHRFAIHVFLAKPFTFCVSLFRSRGKKPTGTGWKKSCFAAFGSVYNVWGSTWEGGLWRVYKEEWRCPQQAQLDCNYLISTS